MYQRWAEARGWKVDVTDILSGETAGIKSATLVISGEYAYGYAKAERGVHRLVRISPFDANKRRHTSFASVDVIAEIEEEAAIVIPPSELQIDTFRSGGKGGQNVNKVETAVRITHLPTGVVVQCQDERSQHKNKDRAMKVLAARLLDKVRSDEQAKQASDRKSQVGSGDRSERIRTYNFPQNRLTDHRINLTLYSLDQIMEGKLADAIDALQAKDVELRLAEQMGSANR